MNHKISLDIFTLIFYLICLFLFGIGVYKAYIGIKIIKCWREDKPLIINLRSFKITLNN